MVTYFSSPSSCDVTLCIHLGFYKFLDLQDSRPLDNLVYEDACHVVTS